MPRPSKGARLVYYQSDGYWYIRDGKQRISTGCTEAERPRAEEKLGEYLQGKHTPQFGVGDPDRVQVVDVLIVYQKEHGPTTRRPDVIYSATPKLGEFWDGKVVGQITKRTCREYVKWRTEQPQARYKFGPRYRFKKEAEVPRVGEQTARRELEVLQSAINYAVGERLLKYTVPVHLPQKSEPRERWLTRDEVAKLLWAAWRAEQGKSRHLCRFILLALYTGTRHEACLRLKWMPSTDSGWVDLERGIIYRKGSDEAQSMKKRTPVPISGRLLAHMRRWKRSSSTHVVEYAGRALPKVKRSWKTARINAGLGPDVVPHILRHTFATWAVMDGQPFGKVAAALGTTERMVQQTYGHHHPDHLRGVVSAVSGGNRDDVQRR